MNFAYDAMAVNTCHARSNQNPLGDKSPFNIHPMSMTFKKRCVNIFFQAFTSSGTNLVLYLGPQHYKDKKEQPPREFVDFDKDPGKVRCFVFRKLKCFSKFIFNFYAIIKRNHSLAANYQIFLGFKFTYIPSEEKTFTLSLIDSGGVRKQDNMGHGVAALLMHNCRK